MKPRAVDVCGMLRFAGRVPSGSNAPMGAGDAIRIGIDTGGTFTDVVLHGPAGRVARKVPSTPEHPADGFLAAVQEVGGLPAEARLHHGTTVGTNAVLTRRGARLVLVTTAGFEDLPWIGRGNRDDLHALAPSRNPPLIGDGMSVGVDERIDARGEILRAPGRATLAQVRAAVAERDPEAIALCLLHAVRNDENERALRAALQSLGVPVHASAALSADPREFERMTTVMLDAFVSPTLRAYVAALLEGLGGAPLTIMRSDGGRMAPSEVERAPVRTLLSGPAGGVAAARSLTARLGVERALSFDVGGTSTDVAWIEGDDVPVRPSLRVGPFEAGVPSVGLETVGAGGGSEVTLDTGGALRVGPASAGADPGPACYGRGGPFTLTDAWLLTGRVPAALLGGDFALNKGAAREAAKPLAAASKSSVAALCEGVVRVAASTTARALRAASVARGKDPRDAALIAFGGAGPVLAAETAALLGMQTVLVPPDPGTFAAWGTLLAPLRADVSRVVASERGLASVARTLQTEVRRTLEREGARRVALRVELDARYAGQAFEVTLPYERRWQSEFHGRHAARYGFASADRPVEAVRLRVRGEGWETVDADAGVRVLARPRFTTRRLTRPKRGPARLMRADLAPGRRVVGPVRIEERTGTTFVPPDWFAGGLDDGTLRMEPRR